MNEAILLEQSILLRPSRDRFEVVTRQQRNMDFSKYFFTAVKVVLFGVSFLLFLMLMDDIWRKYNSKITTTGIQYTVR